MSLYIVRKKFKFVSKNNYQNKFIFFKIYIYIHIYIYIKKYYLKIKNLCLNLKYKYSDEFKMSYDLMMQPKVVYFQQN